MELHTVFAFLFAFLLMQNDCAIAQDNAGAEEAMEKVSCEKPKRRPMRAPPSGGVEDITEEMADIHKKYTDAHEVKEFHPDDEMRRVANTFCSVQVEAKCDLVYPTGIALNAMVAPAFLNTEDIAQQWYNERSNYSPKLSLLENVKNGYTNGYEVIHYANMVANYPNRGLGCCRAPCKDGICFIYACAYGGQGAGSWRLHYADEATEDSEGEGKLPPIAGGFEFHSPGDIGRELIPFAKTNLVRRVPSAELTTVGCSANVAGNGPGTTVHPWRYPCRVSTATTEGIEKTLNMNEALAATTELTAQFKDEIRVLFSPMQLAAGTCDDLSAPLTPPFLLYCPPSCMSASVKQHEILLQIGSPTTSSLRFRQTQRREVDSNAENNKPDYTVEDVGDSICGKAATSKALPSKGGLTLVLPGGTEEYKFDTDGILSKQSCSATQYSFLSCGTNRFACLASLRTQSMKNPWITQTVGTAAKEDIGEDLFILRDSLCEGVEFTVTIKALPSTIQSKFGILARYINPLNFVALELNPLNGIASLHECFEGSCEKRSRYFVGELTERLLHVRFDTPAGTKLVATLDDEKVGEIDQPIGPPMGFYGFALEEYSDLQHIAEVVLHPRMPATAIQRNIYKQSSLLPWWKVEASAEVAASQLA